MAVAIIDNRQEWQPFQKIGRELVDGAIRILRTFAGSSIDVIDKRTEKDTACPRSL